MNKIKNIFITGATGKIGRKLIPALLDAGYFVRALEYRTPVEIEGVETVRGSLEDRDFVDRCLEGMDAVIHLASCKEDKDSFIRVGAGGTFNILDAMTRNRDVKQFIQAGADAGFGIYYYDRPVPIKEDMPFEAYPGVYPLSKVLEETLCKQMNIMYQVPTTVLRFSWVIDQDDILAHDELADPGFGVPVWKDFLSETIEGNAACELIHENGMPGIRHVVDIDDVIQSILITLGNERSIGGAFNIAAPEAFSYKDLAEYVSGKLGIPVVKIRVPEFHDFRIDISLAREVLGYSPKYDIYSMVDKAIAYRASGADRIESNYKG